MKKERIPTIATADFDQITISLAEPRLYKDSKLRRKRRHFGRCVNRLPIVNIGLHERFGNPMKSSGILQLGDSNIYAMQECEFAPFERRYRDAKTSPISIYLLNYQLVTTCEPGHQ